MIEKKLKPLSQYLEEWGLEPPLNNRPLKKHDLNEVIDDAEKDPDGAQENKRIKEIMDIERRLARKRTS